MGKYLKLNKTSATTMKSSLDEANSELATRFSSIQGYCDEMNDVPDYLIYKVKIWWTSIFNDKGEEVDKEKHSEVVYDYRSSYEKYRDLLAEIKRDIESFRNNLKYKRLGKLSTAVQSLITFVEEFDVNENFDLLAQYANGSDGVRVTTDADGTVTIYFRDEDGNEIDMSALLNALYTYTGMSMSAVVSGALWAEKNGLEYDAALQQQLLDGVKGSIANINEIGGFDIASAEDIVNVNATLKELGGDDFKSYIALDSKGNLVTDVGGDIASNFSAGSQILNAYTITGDVTVKSSEGLGGTGIAEEIKLVTEKIVPVGTNEDIDITQSLPDEKLPEGLEEGLETGIGSLTGDATTEGIEGQEGMPDDGINRIPGLTGDMEDMLPEEDNRGTIKVSFSDIFNRDGVLEDFLPAARDDWEELARREVETMDPELLAETRIGEMNRAEALMNNDVNQLRTELSNMGYSQNDVNKFVNPTTNTVIDRDAVVSAFVQNKHNQMINQTAQQIAHNNGGSYNPPQEAPSYKDLKNGSASTNLINRSNDPQVKDAEEKYNKAEEKYNKAVNEANKAKEEANDSLEETKDLIDKYGQEKDNWTKEQVDEYNKAVEEHDTDLSEFNDKKQEVEKLGKELEEAKENLQKEYDEFEERMLEERVKDQEDYESKQADIVETNVSDDALLDALNGNSEQQSNENVTSAISQQPLPSGSVEPDKPMGGPGLSGGRVDSSHPKHSVSIKDEDFEKMLLGNVMGGNASTAPSNPVHTPATSSTTVTHSNLNPGVTTPNPHSVSDNVYSSGVIESTVAADYVNNDVNVDVVEPTIEIVADAPQTQVITEEVKNVVVDENDGFDQQTQDTMAAAIAVESSTVPKKEKEIEITPIVPEFTGKMPSAVTMSEKDLLKMVNKPDKE